MRAAPSKAVANAVSDKGIGTPAMNHDRVVPVARLGRRLRRARGGGVGSGRARRGLQVSVELRPTGRKDTNPASFWIIAARSLCTQGPMPPFEALDFGAEPIGYDASYSIAIFCIEGR